jgi:WD40 repeat protein
LSGDSNLLFTAAADKTFAVWDIVRGMAVVDRRQDASSAVSAAAFAPDGNSVVIAFDDRKVQRMSLKTGEFKPEGTHHDEAVTSLSFSPDGQLLATSGKDSGRHNGQGASSFDGSRLAFNDGGLIRIVDAATDKETYRIDLLAAPPVGLCWSPNNRDLALIMKNGTVEIWDTQVWSMRRLPGSPPAPSSSLCFSPDGATLLLVEKHRGVHSPYVRELGGYSALVNRYLPDYIPYRALFSRSAGLFDTVVGRYADPNGTISKFPEHDLAVPSDKKYSLQLLNAGKRTIENNDGVSALPDYGALTGCFESSEVLLSGTAEGSIKRFDVASGRRLGTVYFPAASWRYSAMLDAAAFLSPADANPSPQFPVCVQKVVADPERNVCLAMTTNRELLRFDTQSSKTVAARQSSNGQFVDLCFARASQRTGVSYCLVAFSDKIVVHDSSSLAEVWNIPSEGKTITALAASLDGKLVAVGCKEHLIDIWSLDSRKLIHTLRGHAESVGALVFSPIDPNCLVSGSYDGDLRVWDLKTEFSVLELRQHTGPVSALAFSGDGKTLVSGATNKDGAGEVLFWSTD